VAAVGCCGSSQGCLIPAVEHSRHTLWGLVHA
jgi:hypothetical protein